jgi:type I site-specific restriction-modification system R (restriction) subunit
MIFIHQECRNKFILNTSGSGKTLTSFKASHHYLELMIVGYSLN